MTTATSHEAAKRRKAVSRSLSALVPWVVIGASILIAGLGLYEAIRAARLHDRVTAGALQDYAAFGAWSFGRHAENTLTATAREVLQWINHGDGVYRGARTPSVRSLIMWLPWDSTCQCRKARSSVAPRALLAFRVGGDSIELLQNTATSDQSQWITGGGFEGLAATLAKSAVVPASLLDSINGRARTVRPTPPFQYIFHSAAEHRRAYAFTLMRTVAGDTVAYVGEYATEDVARMLAFVLDSYGLLPVSVTRGRSNRELLAIKVLDAGGATVFASTAPDVPSASSRVDLGSEFGGLQVEVYLRPDVTGSVIIGGLPQSRVPFLTGVIAIAVVFVVIGVVQLRRERDLARTRAGWISGISHDLRTPIAQVRLHVDMLKLGRVQSPEARSWSLDNIDRETTRLANLVDNLLQYARTGSRPMAPRTIVDVTRVTREVAGELQALVKSQDGAITVEAEDARSMLHPDALRQILLNLLDNAIKYGPRQPFIEVRVRRRDGNVEIAVADRGPGVPADEAERIWQPFVRGRAGDAVGGSGIGLTVVQNTAREYGGRAWVEPRESGGAVFVVAFPAAASE